MNIVGPSNATQPQLLIGWFEGPTPTPTTPFPSPQISPRGWQSIFSTQLSMASNFPKNLKKSPSTSKPPTPIVQQA
jgi:hypothetical protein